MKIISCSLSTLLFFLPLQGADPFVKPETSSQLVKGKLGSYGLWVNPSRWALCKDFSNEEKEDLVFRLGEEFVFGNLRAIPQKKATPQALKESFLEEIGACVQDLQVHLEEFRKVNGVDVLYLQVFGKNEVVSIVFDAYLFGSDSFSTFVSTMCESGVRNQYDQTVLDFLNGSANLL